MTDIRAFAITTGTLLMALVSVTGCDYRDGENPNVCYSPPSKAVREAEERVAANANPAEAYGARRSAADNCVHGLAYRLAHEQDSAAVVAEAVEAQCETEVSYLVAAQASVQRAAQGQFADSFEKLDRDVRYEIRQLATFYVIEARAGHCAVPKAESIFPTKS